MAETEAPESPPSRAGKGIGSKLTKKLGPLPVWGWALGVGGLAFLGYRYWSSKHAAASAATASTAVGAGTTSSGAMGDTGTGYSGGGSDQLAGLLSQLQQQNGTSGAPTGATQGMTNYRAITQPEWASNIGNIYQQLTPGIFTKYDGTVSLLKSPGFVPFSSSPAAGQVSGAAAPTTGSAGAPDQAGVSAPNLTMGPTSPAGAVAVTTPAPAVSPITSGPVTVQGTGTSLGGVPAGGNHIGPLPASGPLV